MNDLIQSNLDKLRMICEEHSVASLFLFGSALNENFDAESDLDFSVMFKEDLSPLEHGVAYFELLDQLVDLFDRNIDLVSYRVIKNPIFKEEIDNTKIALYAAA